MSEQNKQRTRRIRSLVVLSAMAAVILTVSTYAWFIGMRTVNVTSFDVEIKSTESLQLSFDGITWGTDVSISKDLLDDIAATYPTNTNSWPELIPMSSIGDIDSGASRLKLFEKASLTATPGGYRLLASRVNNFGTYTEDPDGAGPLTAGSAKPEQEGYVAFDLFIKNFSGTQYIETYEPLDEEAIYLTTDSAARVAAAGVGGVADTGIENSVRVAFAQIGRVIGTTNDEDIITGITCNSVPGVVTGICQRTAQIWEPNDKNHVDDAIRWYETSCKPRNVAPAGTDITKAAAYNLTGDCSTVVDGQAYPTYAISKAVASSDNIDVYDGEKYNTFTGSSSALVPYPYFTDTMKNYKGTSRPQFMTLAPNSITKVRVYIYIEGQDIDNYDFAQIGKKISVMFGFTKERFTEDDIQYNGPDVNEGEGPEGADKTAPVITLNGESVVTLAVDGTYTEEGATATDNEDETVTVVTTGTVNTAVAGTYTVTYRSTDIAGNIGVKTRTVIVQ